MVRDLKTEGDLMVKIDPKDEYFTVPLCQEHQTFVRFDWDGTLYEFACYPFGLSIASRVLTKITKPIVAFLRQLGIRLIIYLDDAHHSPDNRNSELSCLHDSSRCREFRSRDQLSQVSSNPGGHF